MLLNARYTGYMNLFGRSTLMSTCNAGSGAGSGDAKPLVSTEGVPRRFVLEEVDDFFTTACGYSTESVMWSTCVTALSDVTPEI